VPLSQLARLEWRRAGEDRARAVLAHGRGARQRARARPGRLRRRGQAAVAQKVKLPPGYSLAWGGQFEPAAPPPAWAGGAGGAGADLRPAVRHPGQPAPGAAGVRQHSVALVGGVVALAVSANTCRCRPRWASSR
jgi:cobalt-zinc-cadmium resistance protein CzcA